MSFGRVCNDMLISLYVCFVIWGFNFSHDPSFQISNYNPFPAPLLTSSDPCQKYFQVRYTSTCFNAEKQLHIKTNKCM